MALIYAYRNRGISKDITIQDGAGDTIVPTAEDQIRVVIGREGRVLDDLSGAQLVVSSQAPTANASSFTKNSPSSGVNRLRLDASDLADIDAGVYSLYVDYFDSADDSEWKCVSRQVFVLEES